MTADAIPHFYAPDSLPLPAGPIASVLFDQEIQHRGKFIYFNCAFGIHLRQPLIYPQISFAGRSCDGGR